MPWRPSAARGSSNASSRQLPRRRRRSAEDRDASGIGGQRERLAAFDDRVTRRPAAAPDQAARLVVAAPHVPLGGRHRVGAAAADQRREQRLGVPVREAHPDQVAARADDRAALTVAKQRVLAQRVRRVQPRRAAHRRRAATATAAAATAVAAAVRCAVHCQPQLRAARGRLLVEAAVRRGQPWHGREQVGRPVRGHRRVRDLLRVVAGRAR